MLTPPTPTQTDGDLHTSPRQARYPHVDQLGAAAVRDALGLDDAVVERPGRIEVDLSSATLFGCAGVAGLMAAQKANHGRLVLAGASPPVRKVLTALGLTANVPGPVGAVNPHAGGTAAESYRSTVHTGERTLAWSAQARREPPLPGCVGHGNCANCPRYATQWRRRVLAATQPPAAEQLTLFDPVHA